MTWEEIPEGDHFGLTGLIISDAVTDSFASLDRLWAMGPIKVERVRSTRMRFEMGAKRPGRENENARWRVFLRTITQGGQQDVQKHALDE